MMAYRAVCSVSDLQATPTSVMSFAQATCVLPLQVFGRVVDPENFADQAYLTMNAWQIELADSRIGCLRLFSPDNPTGREVTSY
jgi:hypothetical protein